MDDLTVQCRCGAVRGTVVGAKPAATNRAICYCHDCRAFMHWLQREDLVDSRGGTDLVQVPRNALRVDTGFERVRLMRLTSKGMFRWYAACCRTPLANTVPQLPFAGILTSAFRVPPADLDTVFGPIMHVQTRGALAPGPGDGPKRRFVRVAWLLSKWVLGRRGHPTPFFNLDNRPVLTPEILTFEQRQALRSHPRQ